MLLPQIRILPTRMPDVCTIDASPLSHEGRLVSLQIRSFCVTQCFMQALPELRKDLRSLKVQDSMGVVYYDVYDPKSLATLRLYDFEWHLAEKLNEPKTMPEMIASAKEVLGFEPTPEEIHVFLGHLVKYGICEAPSSPNKHLPLLTTKEVQTSEKSQLSDASVSQVSLTPKPLQTSLQPQPSQEPSQALLAQNPAQDSPPTKASLILSSRHVVTGLLVPLLGLLIYLFTLLFQATH